MNVFVDYYGPIILTILAGVIVGIWRDIRKQKQSMVDTIKDIARQSSETAQRQQISDIEMAELKKDVEWITRTVGPLPTQIGIIAKEMELHTEYHNRKDRTAG